MPGAMVQGEEKNELRRDSRYSARMDREDEEKEKIARYFIAYRNPFGSISSETAFSEEKKKKTPPPNKKMERNGGIGSVG